MPRLPNASDCASIRLGSKQGDTLKQSARFKAYRLFTNDMLNGRRVGYLLLCFLDKKLS